MRCILFTKRFNYFNFLIINILIISACSYDKTELTLGSAFDRTWDFSSSNSFDFDKNLIQFSNGKVSLKPLDLEHIGNDFNNGNNVGTTLDNNLKPLSNQNSNSIDLLTNHSSEIIAHWNFEQNLLDSTANDIDLTESSSSFYSNERKVGEHSLNLNNTNFLSYANTFASNIERTMSIAFWMKSDASAQTAPWNTILEKHNGISDGWIVQRENGTSKIRLRIRTENNPFIVRSITNVFDNKWYHIAFVMTETELKLYVNGTLEDTENITINRDMGNTANPLIIGATDLVGTGSVTALIDDLTIWRSELIPSEIYSLYTEQNLNYADMTHLDSSWTPHWNEIAGYWKLDGNAQDYSGNSHHGALSGDTFFENDQKVGSASADFDGSGDSIDLPNIDAIEGLNEITITGWVKSTSTTCSFERIIDTAQGIAIWCAGNTSGIQGRLQARITNSSATNSYINSGELLPVNQWTHFAIIYKNGTASMYVDGLLRDTKALTGPLQSSPTSAAFIGSSTTAGNYFLGNIDDIAIWTTALTASEVKIIFERQKQKYASHYDSEVIDLGSKTSAWPDISWVTSLPFGKELVGDFDNDGNTDYDNMTSYTSLLETLNNGLIGYWSFNDTSLNLAPGSTDFIDQSGASRHGTETNGVATNSPGQLNSSIELTEGSNQYVEVGDFEVGNNFSLSMWVKPVEFTKNFGQSLFSKHNLSGDNLVVIGCFSDLYHVRVRGVTYENGTCIDSEWQHIAVTISDIDGSSSNVHFYLNGSLLWSQTLNAVIGTVTPGRDWILGQEWDLGSPSDFFFGRIDETAIWNRPITSLEVQQLYRRGANRVKLQVKSCIDTACNCKSYNVAPAGNATDCDGDGTLNDSDTDDSHSAEFIGPGGDGSTFYSELFNRAPIDITFNCALNTTDSNASVCAPDEITFGGNSKPNGPEFLNIDYTQFVSPISNRYAQYRVYMEADNNTSCNGKPCLPEVSSINLNPTNMIKYASEYVEIKPKSPIIFTSIESASIKAEACASFRLFRAPNSYYHDGASWVLVSDESHRNIASEVTENIKQFATQLGAGELEVISYLKSNPTQSDQCTIDEIDINFN